METTGKLNNFDRALSETLRKPTMKEFFYELKSAPANGRLNLIRHYHSLEWLRYLEIAMLPIETQEFICNAHKTTVAHYLVSGNRLAAWKALEKPAILSLRDENGKTVAHVAVGFQEVAMRALTMPDVLELKDGKGNTVEMAVRETLSRVGVHEHVELMRF